MDQSKKYLMYGAGAGMVLMGLVATFVLGVTYGPSLKANFTNKEDKKIDVNTTSADPSAGELAELVLPSSFELPVRWGDLGKRLVEEGVIDRAQFVSLYESRLGFGPAEQKLLDGEGNEEIVMNQDNAGFILNLFWALGLGNKNPVLEEGPMVDTRYGGAGNFASTGGWTLSKGSAMEHYSKHKFIVLNGDEQTKVERVSKGIFRPCCGNSTYFPDCNHGMAMLALLELMASEGASEEEMYKVALQVNAYWFPDTYITLAKYMKSRLNIEWKDVDQKLLLSAEYSSSGGYKQIKSQVSPVQGGGGGGCGV